MEVICLVGAIACRGEERVREQFPEADIRVFPSGVGGGDAKALAESLAVADVAISCSWTAFMSSFAK